MPRPILKSTLAPSHRMCDDGMSVFSFAPRTEERSTAGGSRSRLGHFTVSICAANPGGNLLGGRDRLASVEFRESNRANAEVGLIRIDRKEGGSYVVQLLHCGKRFICTPTRPSR